MGKLVIWCVPHRELSWWDKQTSLQQEFLITVECHFCHCTLPTLQRRVQFTVGTSKIQIWLPHLWRSNYEGICISASASTSNSLVSDLSNSIYKTSDWSGLRQECLHHINPPWIYAFFYHVDLKSMPYPTAWCDLNPGPLPLTRCSNSQPLRGWKVSESRLRTSCTNNKHLGIAYIIIIIVVLL